MFDPSIASPIHEVNFWETNDPYSCGSWPDHSAGGAMMGTAVGTGFLYTLSGPAWNGHRILFGAAVQD